MGIERTTYRAFADRSAIAPMHDAEAEADYVKVQSAVGAYVSLDVHVGTSATTRARTFDFPSFATVEVASREGSVNLFYDVTNLDEAVALRDAANAAIRHLRKLAAKGA